MSVATHRLLLVCVVLACEPQDPPTTVPAKPAAAAAEPVATAPHAEAAAPERADDGAWQMTTLVAQGPSTMIGKHGHYELRFADDGANVSVRRVGQDGAPLPEERTMTGTTTLHPAFVEAPDGGERDIEFTVELANDRGRQAITAHAWVSGDRMVGRWYYTPAPGGSPEGEIVGVLVGRKGIASGFVEVASAQDLPCPICCDAVANCSGMGPAACNTSNVCLAACSPSSEGGSEGGPPPGRTMSDLPKGCQQPR